MLANTEALLAEERRIRLAAEKSDKHNAEDARKLAELRRRLASGAQVMQKVEEDPEIKAAVLISAKPGSFIAGANIKMLENLESGKAAEETAGIGQKGMDRIAAMQGKKPWVAAIDGACLGGGLEVALACSYRIATASPKTVLGLPEVMLGLLPGSGGTQRLIPLVGGQKGLDLMLTGKQLKGDRLDELMGAGGVSDCGNAQNCVKVCPKEIPLTESIGAMGRAVTIHSIARFFSGKK